MVSGMVTYLSVAAGLASIFFASAGVYVAFPCSDRRVVVQYGPLLIAACMGTCHQYAVDCFCTGSVAATMFVGDYWSLAALAVLVFITVRS